MNLAQISRRREQKAARMRRWRARKAQLRIERNKDEPIRGEWRGRFAFTLTYLNRFTGTFHALDFYISDKRVNSYRVEIDGKAWRQQISASEALVWLRTKLPRFALHG